MDDRFKTHWLRMVKRNLCYIYSFVWFWNIVDHWFKQEKREKGGGEFYLWILRLNICYVSTIFIFLFKLVSMNFFFKVNNMKYWHPHLPFEQHISVFTLVIIIRNGAKTISLQISFGDLIRNGAKTISLQASFEDLIRNGANTICLPSFVWGPSFGGHN